MLFPANARLLGGAAALTLALGTATFHVVDQRRTERSWAESVAHADEVQRALESIDYTRDVLWGEATDGSAFEAYDEAVDLLLSECRPYGADAMGVMNLLFHAGDPQNRDGHEYSVKQIERALAFVNEPVVITALESLSRGAHQPDAQPVINWSTPAEYWASFTGRRVLTLAATHKAMTLAESGQSIEAARLILDAAQLGLDHFSSPLPLYQGFGMTLLVETFYRPMSGQCELDAFDREGRAVLLAGLTNVIDRMQPSEHVIGGLFVHIVRYAQHFNRLPDGFTVQDDGPLERDELVDFIALQRDESRDTSRSKTLESLADSRRCIRDRLLALQLALRLDLNGHADIVVDSEGLEIFGELTAETVEVSIHEDRKPRMGYPDITLKRSSPQ